MRKVLGILLDVPGAMLKLTVKVESINADYVNVQFLIQTKGINLVQFLPLFFLLALTVFVYRFRVFAYCADKTGCVGIVLPDAEVQKVIGISVFDIHAEYTKVQDEKFHYISIWYTN